jgi:1,4-alpha-glucan branching enzyme
VAAGCGLPDLPALVSGLERRWDRRSSGITARLDYLVDLGVDAIWISPIFASPMADFGYDVSDYCGIYPPFGTLATSTA